MRSTEKHVLMVRHPVAKGHATYPVSVHTNVKTAALHRARLASAVKAGDVDTVKALAPSFKLTEAGDLPADVKFAVVSLPYEPETPAVTDDSETFEF
jgi:hypothetical protein